MYVKVDTLVLTYVSGIIVFLFFEKILRLCGINTHTNTITNLIGKLDLAKSFSIERRLNPLFIERLC